LIDRLQMLPRSHKMLMKLLGAFAKGDVEITVHYRAPYGGA
jgi:hypothetical protein